MAGQKPDRGAHDLKYTCGWPLESVQYCCVPTSFSTSYDLQVIVSPLTCSHPEPPEHEKMTPPQSKPEGQSLSWVQVMPQKLALWPSVMNERHRAKVGSPQLLKPPQSLQSTRDGRGAHVPVKVLQNCLAGHA